MKPKTVKLWVADAGSTMFLFTKKPCHNGEAWNIGPTSGVLYSICCDLGRRYLGIKLAPGECCQIEITTRRVT